MIPVRHTPMFFFLHRPFYSPVASDMSHSLEDDDSLFQTMFFSTQSQWIPACGWANTAVLTWSLEAFHCSRMLNTLNTFHTCRYNRVSSPLSDSFGEAWIFQIPPCTLPVQQGEAPANWSLQAGGEKSAKNRDNAIELPTTVGQLEKWWKTFCN